VQQLRAKGARPILQHGCPMSGLGYGVEASGHIVSRIQPRSSGCPASGSCWCSILSETRYIYSKTSFPIISTFSDVYSAQASYGPFRRR